MSSIGQNVGVPIAATLGVGVVLEEMVQEGLPPPPPWEIASAAAETKGAAAAALAPAAGSSAAAATAASADVISIAAPLVTDIGVAAAMAA